MLTAAILAGGRATRFGGRDKSALVVEGRTIFDRQMTELSQIAGEILFVGATVRPGDPGGQDHAPGVTMIADLMPGCGPLGGLHAALTAARGEVVLVVACDMPYVSAPLLAHLASLAGGPGRSSSPSCREPNAGIIRCAPRTRAPRSNRSSAGWRLAV